MRYSLVYFFVNNCGTPKKDLLELTYLKSDRTLSISSVGGRFLFTKSDSSVTSNIAQMSKREIFLEGTPFLSFLQLLLVSGREKIRCCHFVIFLFARSGFCHFVLISLAIQIRRRALKMKRILKIFTFLT